ncbi:sensor histidine kinase [Larkinella terrae]|uniref:histidine kinase n=1 Tax=Larkinella terrae TaxID=2025311 RepID=A0A7K0EKF0_9BACT|nr:HAMP domain-containing sensor histidine kinase [Larkinella terrae]MRS61938.1 HAMP domain-containing protein [Larkinella terrae]
MKIRNRIALQFSLIVATILLVFSVVIYFTTATYSRDDFYDRLKSKALTTARFLIQVNEVDRNLLKIIDRNTLTALYDEKVLVFDENNRLIYASVDDHIIHYQRSLLNEVRQLKEVETWSDENQLAGILYEEGGRKLVVLASANDRVGRNKQKNLGITLVWGLLGGISVTIGLGIFFAGQSLEPIDEINSQVSTITARNLRQRLDEGDRRDEIDQLAVNFNAVLGRLEQAFEQQRSFVSHASHELRTPLAALKSEIQLGLRRPLKTAEYETILTNLLSDTDRLIGLTNSLLFLARTLENISQMPLEPVQMEEVVLLARDELLSAKPDYRIEFDYDNLPGSETETTVSGNEELLKRVLLNLMDNACKYSANHTARVRIRTDSRSCWVSVRDQGIGMSPEDAVLIFEPFYRTSNAVGYDGFGIGLSISQRIIELHQGQISVESELNAGSQFTIQLAHL